MKNKINGQDLRNLRKVWKVSQFELSKKIDILPYKISLFESGHIQLDDEINKQIYSFFYIKAIKDLNTTKSLLTINELYPKGEH